MVKKPLSLKIILIVVTALMVIIAVTSKPSKTIFEDGGYFQDGSKNRIFTIRLNKKSSKQAALLFAQQKSNTPRRITAVYFYDSSSVMPIDGITLAKNLYHANHVLYETPSLSPWRYAYMRYHNGTETIVDCKSDPNADLCRQR